MYEHDFSRTIKKNEAIKDKPIKITLPMYIRRHCRKIKDRK